MKVLYKKQINFFKWFLLVSGIGALWLTFMWYRMTFDDNSMAGGGAFSSMNVFYYYIFNSLLLILAALVFSFRFFKTYAVIAIILALSVTGSMFVFHGGQNLFLVTIMLGMTMGIAFGGTILVPMFLFSVYSGLGKSVKHIYGKLAYSYEDPANKVSSDSKLSSVEPLNTKPSLHKVIPMIVLFLSGLNLLQTLFAVISFFRMRDQIPEGEGVGSRMLLMLLVVLSFFILSLVSLKSRNPKVYKILNIIIIIPVLVRFLWPILGGVGIFTS